MLSKGTLAGGSLAPPHHASGCQPNMPGAPVFLTTASRSNGTMLCALTRDANTGLSPGEMRVSY